MRKSLAFKFLLLVTCVLALTMTTVSLINSKLQSERLSRLLVERGQMMGSFIANISPESLYTYDYDLLDKHMRDLSMQQDVVYGVVNAPNGTPLTSYINKNHPQIRPALQLTEQGNLQDIVASIDQDSDVIPMQFPVIHEGETLAFLRIGLSKLNLIAAEKSYINTQMWINFSVLVFLCFALYAVFRYSALRAIKNLTGGAERVAGGNLDQAVEIFSPDELGQLTATFNNMMDNLKETIHAKDGALREVSSLNLALTSEIEERKHAEQVALAASQAKSTFLANMSHEIRTPMNVVLGHTQILQRSQELNDEQKISLSTIQRSGDHLLGLINDILDISQIEVGAIEITPSDFNLMNMLENIIAMFQIYAQHKHLNLKLETHLDHFLPVTGDEVKIKQVLVNLLGNAIKFTEQGNITVFVSRDGDNYTFKVCDTGPGIPEADQQIIFDSFQQSQRGILKGGAGLGLAISRQIIELMNGSLTLESSSSAGSCFTASVPLPVASNYAPEYYISTTSTEYSHLSPGCEVSAVVVDDINENRNVLSTLLRSTGVEVFEVDKGEAVLACVLKNKPDIVFMDINMPGMDGITATMHIRENLDSSKVKCVAISAFCAEHDRNDFVQRGFDDYISKPFRFGRICECISALLNVSFEKIQSNHIPTTPANIDIEAIAISKQMFDRLYQAAEVHEVTSLKNALSELSLIGEKENILANHLKASLECFDFKQILKNLEKVSSYEQ